MRRTQLILFAVFITISLILFFLNDKSALILSENLSSILLFPIKVTTQFLDYLSVSNTRIENLEIEINQLKLQNAQLRKMVPSDTEQFKAKNFKLIKAFIIGRDPQNINGYLYIDKGQTDSITKGQPVIAINGLVGKIKYAGKNLSIVETLENEGFAISAIDIKTGIHGVVKQKQGLLFDYIRNIDTVNINDSILTSGMSQIFPGGILIGKIKKIVKTEDTFFKKVYLTPAVRINRLTSVYVILNQKKLPK